MKNKSKELEVAIQAALEAGKILEQHFETDVLREFKEDNSTVTLADKESEEVIKKIIFSTFPKHSVLGEETGKTQNEDEYIWHIDPIDGTRNFANGIPLFAVSLALEYKGEIIVGVIYNPVTNSMFYAQKGKGSYSNNKRIFVSKDDTDRAMVTASSAGKSGMKELFSEILHSWPRKVVSSIRYLGCTALDLAYVARGGLEATIQLGFATYDFAAGVIIIKEAGGIITRLDGSPWAFPENYFIASNGIFHDTLVSEVRALKDKLGIKQ